MSAVTQEMIYELAVQVRRQLGTILSKADEANGEARALVAHAAAMRYDTRNILAILMRQDERLSRMEQVLQDRSINRKPRTP